MANLSVFFRTFCATWIAVGLATFAHGVKADQETQATPWVEIHAARVRLVGTRWKAGEAHYLVGLEVALDDGWKTYWRMPGDSGVPPTFEWTGSTNLEKANVLYPAPVRMKEAGGEAIGYEGTVLFPIATTPKDTDSRKPAIANGMPWRAPLRNARRDDSVLKTPSGGTGRRR